MDQAAKARIKYTKRAHPRYDLGILAMLMTDRNEFIGFARVRDMSGGGAKLILSDQVKLLPDHFVMALGSKSGPRRYCSVVWQNDNKVGVQFVAVGNPSH